MADNDSAAFGHFPQLKRKRSRQDPEAAKDLPLNVLRGWAAGTLGLPGDLEGLARLLIPGVDNTPALPNSDFYKEWLPLRDDRPTSRAATEVGSLFGGAGSTNLARHGVKTAKGAGSVAKGALETMAANRPAYVPASQEGVIKLKGGNWLKGDGPERLTDGLKRGAGARNLPAEQVMAEMRATYSPESIASLSPESRAQVERAFRDLEPKVAMNTWLDQKLAKYVQNEMGTPEDPVRALAERGVLHYDPTNTYSANRTVHPSGEVLEKLGASDLARKWENSSDYLMRRENAGTLLEDRMLGGGVNPHLRKNPWLEKVDPQTPVYRIDRGSSVSEDLGFDHLRDELKNMLDPNSGLPRELLLTPEQLGKVTMPQAVERVHKVNQWRAAQKAEADLARANNAATVVHKDYPDKGFKWVELKAPEAKAVEDLTPDQLSWYNEYLDGGVSPEKALSEAGKRGHKSLEDALKYEGETMGHCVGGYCPDVLEGRSRIYSLRDAKGQPHVTIEVAPSNATPYDTWYNTADPTEQESFKQWLQEVKPDSKGGLAKWYEDWVKETGRTPAQPRSSIVQIKGKGNAKPKDEYLPFVQDFVRSGKWSEVGDYGNTGFLQNMRGGDRLRLGSGYIDLPDQHFTAQELMDLVRGHDSVKGLDPKEVEGFLRGQLQNQYLPPDTGFAEGGSVDLNSLTQKYSAQLRDYITARKRRESDGETAEEKPRTAPRPERTMSQPDFANLQRKYAAGGAVFGGGGAQSGEGDSQAALSPEMIARMLGANSEGLLQVTHTPSAYWYDQNYDPAYAAQYWAEMGQPEPQRPVGGTQEVPYTPPNYSGGAVFGGGSNMTAAPPPPPPVPQSPSPAPGPSAPPSPTNVYQPPALPPAAPLPPQFQSPGNGMGVPTGLGPASQTGSTRYPYMPSSVYSPAPMLSSAGSWFPINYNPAKTMDTVKHLLSQMYV